MVAVRLMREADADAVRRLDANAFYEWERKTKGGDAQRYLRTRANVLMCREHDPEGCFVAEDAGDVVGFIFSRTWGSIGWFGTFAVLPSYQGRGVGRQLITAALDYLYNVPVRVIGLETMADSPYNLGLYLRLGFEIRFPTVMLSIALDQSGAQGTELRRWSSARRSTRERWLPDLRRAAGAVLPGLDYSKEILSTERHKLGDTLVLTAGDTAVGMSTVWLVSACEGWGADRANVKALVLHPDHTNGSKLRELMGASEDLARIHGKKLLTVSVNARHQWALARLLEWGYRVRGMAVHMVLSGTDDRPPADRCVEFSRWAG